MCKLPISLLLLMLDMATCSLYGEGYINKCQPIFIHECKAYGYNQTASDPTKALFPRPKEERQNMFNRYKNVNCSPLLRMLLCPALAPMCDIRHGYNIGPCGVVCFKVFNDCSQHLKRAGISWPKELNCSAMPYRSGVGENMCLEPKGGLVSTTKEDSPNAHRDFRLELDTWKRRYSNGRVPPDCSHLRNAKQYVFNNYTAECALSCNGNDLFTDEDKQLAEIWMAVLSCICCLSSLATILTFLIDRQRFKYPVRPVVIMALCYLFYSLSFVVRLVAGRENTACDTAPLSRKLVLTNRGLDNANCAVVFLLQYFFGTAASAWFAMLVLTWLLQAAWKWSPEAVAKRSCYFHAPAWIAPISLTVAVLIFRRVEADELFGMCGVGHRHSASLLIFVIMPNLMFLLLEAACLAAGTIAMWRVRKHVLSGGQPTRSFDMLMFKIFLFSTMYMLPTAFVCAVNIYEYRTRELWHLPGSPHRPSVTLQLLRMFASLAIGLTTGMWIWSCKTINSWRECLGSASGSRSPARPGTKDGTCVMTLQRSTSKQGPAASTMSEVCKQQLLWQQQQQQQQQQMCYSLLPTRVL